MVAQRHLAFPVHDLREALDWYRSSFSVPLMDDVEAIEAVEIGGFALEIVSSQRAAVEVPVETCPDPIDAEGLRACA